MGVYLMYLRKNLSRNSPSRVERLKEIGCRGVYAVKRKLLAEIPAPLCCVTLLKPIESVEETVMLI